MRTLIWNEGPPPFVGWWDASLCRGSAAWRWWNGQNWSTPAWAEMSAWAAADCAQMPCLKAHEPFIQWTDHWPENARVERRKP